jgi:hypothetical protein
MGKKQIICIDVDSVIDGWTIDKTVSIAEHYGYLFYDSHNTRKSGIDIKPYMIDPDEVMDKILVDVSTEEGKKILELYNIKYKEDFKE